MTHIARTFGRALTLATLVAMLAACGGGSDSTVDSSTGGGSSGGGGGGGTATIEGIATPSSVSVVTATNAN